MRFCIVFISVNTPGWNLILFYFFLRQQSIWKEETEVYMDVCGVNQNNLFIFLIFRFWGLMPLLNLPADQV